jgi:hypothetical protein
MQSYWQTQFGKPGIQFWLITIGIVLIVLIPFWRVSAELYELREGGLFVRQGWKKSLIPYESIEKILPISSTFQLFSPNRLLVMNVNGDALLVSVAEKERFFAEMFKKCPQLAPKDTMYGSSLQRPVF